MVLARNYLATILVCITVVNQIRLPVVTCQDDDSTQCIPKAVFLALLRYPEVSSNLAAYSRSARVTQDAKSMSHLKALTEDSQDDGTQICVPGRVYLQLLKDPVVRGDLSIALSGRTQKLPDFVGRLLDDDDDLDGREFQSESQKRSIAMLAKNDDLPISIYDRIVENDDDEEKRAVMASQQSGQNGAEIQEYLIPGDSTDLASYAQDLSTNKRNVGTLARDFALPPGRRNIASLVRDYDQSKGSKDRMLPLTGKRNVAALARTYTLPQSGKRNVASVARDYGLPYGKRYVGSLAKMGYPVPFRQHRSVSSLARNSAWPVLSKRGISLPGSVILRTISRHGRSLADELNTRNDLPEVWELEQNRAKDYETMEDKLSDTLADLEANSRRLKRQIDFSGEYPLPVMQNTNVFDYEDLIDALNGQYPYAEKRFMGTGSALETQPEVGQFGYPETFQTSKRHIGALARLGWLSSLRAARFSRSPRYLVDRENPADGPTPDDPGNAPRSLRSNFNPRTRHVQALHGDCRHGFKRFHALPATDMYYHPKLPSSLRSKYS